MIFETTGNIFDSTADWLVNPVNCAGAMGKGLAFKFRERYPSMYAYYKDECLKRNIKVGKVNFWNNKSFVAPGIILFPTKQHWSNPSKLEWIDSGLEYLNESILGGFAENESIAVPAIGCGYGGLDIADVKPLIYKWLDPVPNPVYLYL